MKLSRALLCVNCDEVYEVQGLYNRCPSCGSEAYALISRWVPAVTKNTYDTWIKQIRQEVDNAVAK